MTTRKPIPKDVELRVLLASSRRCCLCFYLCDRKEVRKGQLAHLNHRAEDSSFENLLWLCLEHHDEFDGQTSQSKGFTEREVRAYRDRLYEQIAAKAGQKNEHDDPTSVELPSPGANSDYDRIREELLKEKRFTFQPWRFPLWQVANRPELFAYKTATTDGVCLIERIDLPDGRIVIACIAIEGNPGRSITNSVEDVALQVCERFEIPARRLIWLEHYDYDRTNEWDMVTFDRIPPNEPFADPEWHEMTTDKWNDLRLRPKRRLRRRNGNFDSNCSFGLTIRLFESHTSVSGLLSIFQKSGSRKLNCVARRPSA